MTRQELEELVQGFLDSWDEGREEFTGVQPILMVLIRCRTDGCPRNDDSIQEISPMATPSDGVWKNICGTCSRPVEDLNPQLSDDLDYRLPARYPDGTSWMEGA